MKMKNHDSAMAIHISNLSYRYGNQAVLEHIDVDIAAGRFTVVLGKNGCGKSTLFRLIAGFLKSNDGEISLFGRSIATFSDRERARILGFLPQHHRPVFPFTVLDVVLTGRAGHVQFTPKEEDRLLAHQALVRIGITALERRLFTELSGGEQQLVMLARILAQKPQIILLDEPISHLDFAYQAKVMNIIGELVRENITVVAILHDPNIAALYGDDFLCLKDGRLIDGYDRRQLPSEVLEKVYGIKLTVIQFAEKNLVMPTRKVDHTVDD